MMHRGGRRAGRFPIRSLAPLVLASALFQTLIPSTALGWDTTTITLTDATSFEAGDNSRGLLSHLEVGDASPDGAWTRLVAVPSCDGARVSGVFVSGPGGEVRLDDPDGSLARVESVAKVRGQSIAIVRIDAERLSGARSALGLSGEIRISVEPVNGRGRQSRNAGPFTRVLEKAVLNYEPGEPEEARWHPPSVGGSRLSGTATYCHSVADCEQSGVDLLFLVAEQLSPSPIVDLYASHEARYLGLNVGIVSTASLPELTSSAVHDFIQDVYETQSAAHFSDGHLGFVVLIGDAYADDNVTVMLPEYDGYGGLEEASDHYYACVSGDDELEDVMIGRLSVGNLNDLVAAVNKTANYTPLPSGEPWTKSVLLVAGLFYTIKDDYVTLFDEYESLIPDDWTVERIYRHDYLNDHLCSLDIIDGFNDGHMFVNFAGDGWISTWYRAFDTTDIPALTNGDRLPIVLSMACMTGWFDNVTEIGPDGSYDCLAEQFLQTPGKGAVACLAASRSSDGGIFRTFTKEIYRAVYDENCVFLGETIAVAKLLHIQNGGNPRYVRHFNLFGDPALAYRWYEAPDGAPDLVVHPHETGMSPDLPATGDDLSLELTVRNQSAVGATGITIRALDISGADTSSVDVAVQDLDPWASATVYVTIPAVRLGPHCLLVTVDPDGLIDEIDEENNTFLTDVFVYPHAQGFPAETGEATYGACIAALANGEPGLVVMGGEARVRAIGSDGVTLWTTSAATEPVDYGPEIAPVVGDLDADGRNEIVATRRMGLAAFDDAGGPLWDIVTSDPVGTPILADADGDGDLDIVVATRMFFGGYSQITAIDENGTIIWSFNAPPGNYVTTTPVAGDLDGDGRPEFCYGTQAGCVEAVSCSGGVPASLWGPVQISGTRVRVLGLADLDSDGRLEVAIGGQSLSVLNAEDGSVCWTASTDSDVVSLALGDLDADGTPDAIFGTVNGTISALESGNELWSVALPAAPWASAAVADVAEAQGREVCVLSEDGTLFVLDAAGAQVMEPMPVPGAQGSPFIGQLTDDEGLEICVGSSEGRVFVFASQDCANGTDVEWAGAGGGAGRSGLLSQPVAGTFTEDVFLSGRCRISGDLVVGAGATLHVMPGTVIETDADASPVIEVWGNIEASGNPTSGIVFRADPIFRAVWQGIRLQQGATAQLAWCSVSGAVMGLRGKQSSVTLADCAFEGNAYGAYLDACTVDATSSSFSDSDSTGMYLSGGSGTIRGCRFEGNTVSGLFCSGSSYHHLAQSTFSGTTAGRGLVCKSLANVQADTCSITNNAVDGAFLLGANATFVGCTLSDNNNSGIFATKLANCVVYQCTITGNKFGVFAAGGARPNIGLGDGLMPLAGQNSIHGNRTAAVANFNISVEFPVSARENWWGSYPPNGRVFLGYVRYVPCLQSPPGAPPGSTVGIPEDGQNVPATPRLGQCVPNPFNPSTSIEYDVPADAGPIDISVYDVAGRRVRTLYSGRHEPGTYSVIWDGRDRSGRAVAGGVYFARLETSDFSAAVKMVLLK